MEQAPPSGTPTAKPRRKTPEQIVACELWPPNGHPPNTTLTGPAIKKLAEELKRRRIKVRSDDTLRRAIGRR
jgi:hypothetical protein